MNFWHRIPVNDMEGHIRTVKTIMLPICSLELQFLFSVGNMKLPITQKLLDNFPEDIPVITDSQIPGFIARQGKPDKYNVRKISLYMQYRIGGVPGKQRKFKICNAGDLSIKDIRKKALELRAELFKGKDPFQERISAIAALKEQKQTTVTCNDLMDEFETVYCQHNRRRPEEVSRSFKADVRPAIGSVAIEKLDRRLIIMKVLDPILKRGAKAQANKTLSLLKQLLQFGVERGLLEVSPLVGTKRMNIGGIEKSRTRALSFTEIEIFLAKLDGTDISSAVKKIVILLLLTGCRVNEICRAKWQDIDFDNKMWTIPAENVKAKLHSLKAHKIPITSQLCKLLKALKESSLEGSAYIVPSPTDVHRYLDKRSVARAINRHMNEFTIEAFTPHDLRRTVQTRMAELGIHTIVIEKLLNHELSGMPKIYDQYNYMPERKKALKKWHKRLNAKSSQYLNACCDP